MLKFFLGQQCFSKRPYEDSNDGLCSSIAPSPVSIYGDVRAGAEVVEVGVPSGS